MYVQFGMVGSVGVPAVLDEVEDGATEEPGVYHAVIVVVIVVVVVVVTTAQAEPAGPEP
jgi:hypothetical protein